MQGMFGNLESGENTILVQLQNSALTCLRKNALYFRSLVICEFARIKSIIKIELIIDH